ncbi:hypothetical protein WJX72_005119 [[Myrmecia] bisecta]|uniref:Uncharacterized protein n=1 Tax=[Myrmecia] bisecta TaxID=41462 RepID=A0AAW1PEQ5_9CHLO
MLTKGQLLAFFATGQQLLDKPDVKQQLKEAKFRGEDVQQLITSLQEQLFESQGIQGKFGIQCLGKVNLQYKDDPALLSKFYEFVGREEAAIDEAELPPEVWERKKKMLEQQRVFNEQLRQMSPEQQQAFMQQQQLVAKALQAQQHAMAEQLQRMTPEQQQAFMMEQRQKIVEQLSGGGTPDSSMSTDQQANFFRSLHSPGAGAP